MRTGWMAWLLISSKMRAAVSGAAPERGLPDAQVEALRALGYLDE